MYYENERYHVTNTTIKRLGRFQIHLDTINKDNKEYHYSYVEQKDSVGVLAFDGDKIILVYQYRHSIKGTEYEIPGGGIETNENPVDVAIREMMEETGFAVDSIEELGKYYPSPGSSNETCYLFLANCHKETEPQREPLELMTVELLSESELFELIKSGQFMHSMGLVAWMKYCIKRGLL